VCQKGGLQTKVQAQEHGSKKYLFHLHTLICKTLKNIFFLKNQIYIERKLCNCLVINTSIYLRESIFTFLSFKKLGKKYIIKKS